MSSESIISADNLVYAKPELMNDNHMHYCPGCSHGVVHKLVAEVVKEMNIQDKTIGIAPVGCAVFAYNYIDIDWQQAAHGRAPALATAAKRLLPDKMVFTYQGDGDLAAIGTAETIHAANRGENIAIIFINNGIPVTKHRIDIINLWTRIIVRIRIERTLRFFFNTIFCIKYILVRYFCPLLFEFKYIIRFLIYSLCLCFSWIID